MKTLCSVVLLLTGFFAFSQGSSGRNVFIITVDGLRWQEIFKGADSLLINNEKFVADSELVKSLYWDETIEGRRKKLLPFLWNVVARQGQLYGNRLWSNQVNAKNIWKVSYPGYNELLTGYADPLPMLNALWYNPNQTVLEYLNKSDAYWGKVVAFTSWNVFPFILNKKRNRQLINSGYQKMEEGDGGLFDLINKVQDSLPDRSDTRKDLLTFLNAKEYIRKNHPPLVFLSLGEADELAHKGAYDLYLQAANHTDRMLAELWYFIQTDPFYKNNTTVIITTDHGRGNRESTWHKHNVFTKGSGEAWLALLGPGIEPVGEMKTAGKIELKQVAATIALLLDADYQPSHSVAAPIQLPAPAKSVSYINAGLSYK